MASSTCRGFWELAAESRKASGFPCDSCSKIGKSARSFRASSFVCAATAMHRSYPSDGFSPCAQCGRAGGEAAQASALRNTRFERVRERLAHRLELDPVEHVLEEATHDQPLGLRARQTARHQVEELLAIDLAQGRAVGAAHVVGQDLEAGDRVCM